jgi:hypothetical protein
MTLPGNLFVWYFYTARALKAEAMPTLNWSNTMPWTRMGEWMYRSTYYWPRRKLEVSVSFTARPLYLLENALSTQWIGDWVGPGVGVDDMERIKTRVQFWTLGLSSPVASRCTDCAIPASIACAVNVLLLLVLFIDWWGRILLVNVHELRYVLNW